MSERIAQIKARLDAASSEAWEVMATDAGHSQYEMNVWIVDESTGDILCDMDGLMRSRNEKYDDDGYDDAVFIANAPKDVSYLLSLVELLQHRLATEKVQQCTCWKTGLPLNPIMIDYACPIHRAHYGTTTTQLKHNTSEQH